MTNIQDDQAVAAKYALLQQHFSDREMVDLPIAISSINAWNRLAIASGAEWAPPGRTAGEGSDARNSQEVSATESGPDEPTARTEEAL